jgi:hypothetical protein
MYQAKLGARAEYREQEGKRVRESTTLADRFRRLKSLTVNLTYCDPDSLAKSREIKYEVNLANAKSVFRFSCPNDECVQGDFDLSEELAKAVDAHRGSVSGEIACQGWLSKTTIDKTHCRNILRYKLTMTY